MGMLRGLVMSRFARSHIFVSRPMSHSRLAFSLDRRSISALRTANSTLRKGAMRCGADLSNCRRPSILKVARMRRSPHELRVTPPPSPNHRRLLTQRAPVENRFSTHPFSALLFPRLRPGSSMEAVTVMRDREGCKQSCNHKKSSLYLGFEIGARRINLAQQQIMTKMDQIHVIKTRFAQPDQLF